jgi:hypothetical protein
VFENQAFLGFAVCTMAFQNARRCEIVYNESLAIGMPAEAARLKLYLSYEIVVEDGLYEGLLRLNDARLYGDEYARLRGV